MSLTRRRTLLTLAGGFAAPAMPAFASPADKGAGLPNALRARALAAFARHETVISRRDQIGIADFSRPSSAPRFHILNLENGAVSSHLVAHGRGSDPAHTGWLQSFSNRPSSNATSAGAYRTCDLYIGQHGRSMRLSGLDDSNSNAMSRAVVIHAAWYVSDELAHRGRLGRSNGCFAFAEKNLSQIIERLGDGRLLYADKV